MKTNLCKVGGRTTKTVIAVFLCFLIEKYINQERRTLMGGHSFAEGEMRHRKVKLLWTR